MQTRMSAQSHVSVADLLRLIGADLRSLYADVLKRPLPRSIRSALSRMDEEGFALQDANAGHRGFPDSLSVVGS